MSLNVTQWAIIEELRKHPDGIQRDILAKNINIKRSTVFDNLIKLERNNYVYKMEEDRTTIGRPRVYWYINYDAFEIVEE